MKYKNMNKPEHSKHENRHLVKDSGGQAIVDHLHDKVWNMKVFGHAQVDPSADKRGHYENVQNYQKTRRGKKTGDRLDRSF